MIYSVDIRAVAPVHETEVTDRVVDALRAVFPDADVEEAPGRVVATTHSLDHLSERLHEREILDTARREFLRDADDEGFSFALKKQAATRGVVTFAVDDDDELGVISVDVDVAEPSVEAVVDHVAPPTEDGEPQV